MILSDFERRLKACNSKLHIKRYGSSLAGVHYGNDFICRIPQGEILEHNCFEIRKGNADQYISDFNPTGEYRYKYLTRRGRREAAQIIFTEGTRRGHRIISYSDIARIAN